MNTETRNIQAEETRLESTRPDAIQPETIQPEAPARPEKENYMARIRELSAEDQAFMDGYLFAKVTSCRKPA